MRGWCGWRRGRWDKASVAQISNLRSHVQRTVTLSKQINKALHADISLPQDRAESTAVQLLVIRYHDLREWFIAAQDDVTRLLTTNSKPARVSASMHSRPETRGSLVTQRPRECR